MASAEPEGEAQSGVPGLRAWSDEPEAAAEDPMPGVAGQGEAAAAVQWQPAPLELPLLTVLDGA